ncbi:hypothetical protein BEI46_18350 [Aliivibrio fischeri]|uniref:hypothetical protein n=1 Tax=Aliivibrio fischeri TaxID=668 RepID=UPI00084BED1A|nr:hypothetical protein [Aliivibrio fischeri]OED52746.1 hypothetical protein BEI46_18350 [Aliivibrio fischeri]
MARKKKKFKKIVNKPESKEIPDTFKNKLILGIFVKRLGAKPQLCSLPYVILTMPLVGLCLFIFSPILAYAPPLALIFIVIFVGIYLYLLFSTTNSLSNKIKSNLENGVGIRKAIFWYYLPAIIISIFVCIFIIKIKA